MPARRKRSLDISDPEQLAVLESPACLEILNHAASQKSLSVPELAEGLGRSATSLYPHVRRLVGAKLLLEAGERGSGRERTTLYAAAAREINMLRDTRSRRRMASLQKAVSANLRLATREVSAALSDPEAVTSGRRRDTYVVRGKSWLSDAELAEVNQLLDGIAGVLTRARRNRAGDKERRRLVSLSVAMARCEARRDLRDS